MRRTPSPPYAEDSAFAIVVRGQARRIALRGHPIEVLRAIARPATTRTPSHGGCDVTAGPPRTFAGTLQRPRRAVDPHATTWRGRARSPSGGSPRRTNVLAEVSTHTRRQSRVGANARRPSPPTFEHRAHSSTPFGRTSTASRAGHGRRGAPRDVRRDAAPTSPGTHPPQESSCPHPGLHVRRPHEHLRRHRRGAPYTSQRPFVPCALGALGSLARPEAPASWRCSCWCSRWGAR